MPFVVSEVRVGLSGDGSCEIVFAQVVGNHDEAMRLIAERAVAAQGKWNVDEAGAVTARGADGFSYRWDVDPVN